MQNSTKKMKKSEIQLFNREKKWRFFTKNLRLENGFLHQMSFSQGSATFRFLFWVYFSCGFSAVAFSLIFSIYVVGSPLACHLGRLGPFPHPLVSLVSANHATTLNLVQPPWNFVEEFGIAGNPNKGYSVSSQLNQTEP